MAPRRNGTVLYGGIMLDVTSHVVVDTVPHWCCACMARIEQGATAYAVRVARGNRDEVCSLTCAQAHGATVRPFDVEAVRS
jgi:cbb3-type cytochrome oxidase cytochrome c subunit